MGFIILSPLIFIVVTVISYFLTRKVYRRLLAKDDPSMYIMSTLTFIASFIILFGAIFILSVYAGAFSRGGPNLDRSYLDTMKINSSRIDTLNRLDSNKLK